jgi:hypothetical protein
MKAIETMSIQEAKTLVKVFDPVGGFILQIWKHADTGVRKFRWSPFAFNITDMAGRSRVTSRMLVTWSPSRYVDGDNAFDIDAVELGKQVPRYETQDDAIQEGFASIRELLGVCEARKGEQKMNLGLSGEQIQLVILGEVAHSNWRRHCFHDQPPALGEIYGKSSLRYSISEEQFMTHLAVLEGSGLISIRPNPDAQITVYPPNYSQHCISSYFEKRDPAHLEAYKKFRDDWTDLFHARAASGHCPYHLEKFKQIQDRTTVAGGAWYIKLECPTDDCGITIRRWSDGRPFEFVESLADVLEISGRPDWAREVHEKGYHQAEIEEQAQAVVSAT